MTAKSAFYKLEDGENGKILHLAGEWVIEYSRDIDSAIAALSPGSFNVIQAAHAQRLDTWGSLRVQQLAQEAGAGLYLAEQQQKLFDLLAREDKADSPPVGEMSSLARIFIGLGILCVNGWHTAIGMIAFIGEIAVCFARTLLRPRRFRFHSIVRHIDETGLRALPIIALLAILISMVISYQAATQLAKFGANIFTIDLTVISLLREMGVLVTAIMVAGRSGSAFAAEIGVMKLREEIDALRTMSMDPIEVLVLPRLIAMMITLPLLAFLSVITGIAGGSIISITLLDIPFAQYIDRVEQVANSTMFFVGMVKAPVFAFIITVVGCYQGMNVTGSAESVGRLTTISVVQSIFLVIMVDAFFSLLFVNMGL